MPKPLIQTPPSVGRLQAARDYAAKIEDDIADHAFDKDFGFADHVTEEDKQRYADEHRKYAEEIRAGKHDHNFTVWQRIHFFLTGECVPFLPPASCRKHEQLIDIQNEGE